MPTNSIKRLLQYVSCVLIAGATVLAIITPENSFIEKYTDYTVHLMIATLLIGFVSLFFNHKRLMATSLASCMALCIFLKGASNDIMVLPTVNAEPQLSIAHFNVSNIQDVAHLLKTINEVQPEVLSFQELTPDWNYLLQEKLKIEYPYNMSIVRIDPYGMALYSKNEFTKMDTFMYDGKPNLDAQLQIDDQPIHLIGSYLVPNVSRSTSQKTKEHLDLISYEIRDKKESVIALGDYNMVYWANAISRFRTKAQVIHSRRDISEGRLKPPYDHIFYSMDMECTSFQNINDLNENHIGILGIYQIKAEDPADQDDHTVLSSLSF